MLLHFHYAGNKFTVTPTNVLLMTVVILLLTLIMTKSQETVYRVQTKSDKKE